MKLDPTYVWYWRVLGYGANGSVIDTIVVHDEASLDAAHDTLHETAGVRDCYTAGPFPARKTTA